MDTADASIVDLIQQVTALSRQSIKRCLASGAVWLTRDGSTRPVRRVKKPLNIGDQIHFYYDSKVLEQRTDPAILIEDQQGYSLWFKPSGMLSQGSKWGDHCTIQRWVETRIEPQRPVFIVHRLDRAASGLMILAHTKTVAAALAEQFKTRVVGKTYRAIARGKVEDNFDVNTPIDDRPAKSRVSVSKAQSDLSLVEVSIETGRKHQIRIHLAESGHPILGDRAYDENYKEGDPDLCLVSYQIEIDCPINGERRVFNLPEEHLVKLEDFVNA